MTTFDIIKALPMDEKLRMQVLNLYPIMDASQKFAITKVTWTTYMSIYNHELDSNVELQLAEAAEGKETIDEDFYARAVKKTEKTMERMLNEGLEHYDLSAARLAMQQIINEINASKKPAIKKTQ